MEIIKQKSSLYLGLLSLLKLSMEMVKLKLLIVGKEAIVLG
jgi:hypothetical protein